jgi:hypothetical protein
MQQISFSCLTSDISSNSISQQPAFKHAQTLLLLLRLCLEKGQINFLFSTPSLLVSVSEEGLKPQFAYFFLLAFLRTFSFQTN